MFNHARTLLANVKGGNSSPGPDFLAEELIPKEFRPVDLPTYLQQIRMFLFGSRPDRAMINYRCRQFLTLIHATPLDGMIRGLDPRITYDTGEDNSLFTPETFQPQINRYAGNPGDTLTLLGDPIAPDISGKLRYQYDVDILTPNTVEVKRITPQASSVITEFTMTDGLSSEILLQELGYRFKINSTNPGTSWTVEGYLRPKWDLGQLVSLLERLQEPILLQLFGLTHEEPWDTLRNLWFDHPELPYRLAGFLLAVIYRTEEVRVG